MARGARLRWGLGTAGATYVLSFVLVVGLLAGRRWLEGVMPCLFYWSITLGVLCNFLVDLVGGDLAWFGLRWWSMRRTNAAAEQS